MEKKHSNQPSVGKYISPVDPMGWINMDTLTRKDEPPAISGRLTGFDLFLCPLDWLDLMIFSESRLCFVLFTVK